MAPSCFRIDDQSPVLVRQSVCILYRLPLILVIILKNIQCLRDHLLVKWWLRTSIQVILVA